MTSPDVSPRSLILFSASVLGWIAWLSHALKFIFGAGISSGWLVAGTLFSLMAIGFILMLREVIEAVEDLRLRNQQIHREPAKKGRPENPRPIRKSAPPLALDRNSTSEPYRIALGLKPRKPVANRRRTRHLPAARAPRLQSS